MTLKEKATQVYALRLQKEALEKQIEELKSQVVELESQIDPLNQEILNDIDEQGVVELIFEDDDLTINKFSKETKGYNEVETIKYLKEHNLPFINVKETLNKKDLNKELKTNKELEESLKPLYEIKTTSWVVVTNLENHTKMLEHINEGK